MSRERDRRPRVFRTRSEAETEAAGMTLASLLDPGDVVGLQGDLGSGKTVFVRGVVQGLGGDPEQVHSPTFALANRYQTPHCLVNHLDLYRLCDERDLDGIGFQDLVRGHGVSLVEWIERIPAALAEETWHVTLAWVPGLEGAREVTWHRRSH